MERATAYLLDPSISLEQPLLEFDQFVRRFVFTLGSDLTERRSVYLRLAFLKA